MRFMLITVSALAFAVQANPAQAIGCFSGAVVGGAAGHLANHGILGAIGGCIAGHQLNKRQKRQEQMQQQQYEPRPYRPQDGTRSRTY